VAKKEVFRDRIKGEKMVVKGEAKKNKAVNNLITKIFVYSAIKINAKVPPAYSVLNPETSSDSPSARSKGVRFVSARQVVNQRYSRGKIKGAVHIRGE